MNNEPSIAYSEDVFKRSSNKTELFLKTGNRYEKLNMNDLIFIIADGKYIELHFKNGKRLMRISLINFLKESFQIDLVRIHKAFAVNTAYITSYRYQEVTISGQKLPVGRRYKENLLKHNTFDTDG